MNQSPTIYDVMSSIASRRKEMADIHNIVKELLHKVKKLNQRHDELRSLNFLDSILLKELQENASSK
jgi:hypothetical protein